MMMMSEETIKAIKSVWSCGKGDDGNNKKDK
jgi:hypothetical protein